MAAAAKTQGGTPHTSSNKLEDQAATAALYVTRGKGKSKSSHPILDEDGKLSLAGAATSLKYAQPQDLPSFPSPGLQIASAGAAATLADTHKKTVELWRPGSIPAAEKAASLAKDYEVDPLWHPKLSKAGSKAALLASDRGAHVNTWKPIETDAGHSAAEQAARKGIPPPIDHRAVPADASRKALMAAAGAMESSRRRADSAPTRPVTSPPGTSISSQWALKAATQSQRGKRSGLSTESGDPARVQNMAQNNVSRQMYTSHPPVSIEVEEKNRQDTIRASAVAMAQKMYSIQQRAIEEAKADISRADSRYAARNVHNRRTSDASSMAVAPDPLTSPLYGNNLQEAAQRLAQERLSKLRDEHEEYKTYYGQKSPTTRSRLSIHSKLRRRASSDGAVDGMDEEQSRKIRSQMSIFQNNLATVDEKKRQKDREALLAAAQRNVRASMHSMDEEVFQETGKSSPAQREEWAIKAKEKAQADSNTRMENYGKVHIGGGKYLDQADVDAIAKSRIQPTLDDMNEKAETQRARELEIKLERGEHERQTELEKRRATELKAEQKKAREEEKREEKSKKLEEKRAHEEEMLLLKEKEKVEKEELKMRAKVEKDHVKERRRLEDEEKRKSKDKGKAPEPGTKVATPVVVESKTPKTTRRASTSSSDSLKDSSDEEVQQVTGKSTEEDAVVSPTSPSKRQSKVKSWFAGRFRSSSKPAKESDDGNINKAGFIGGAGLIGASSTAEAGEDKAREGSMRDVAMAGMISPISPIHPLVTIPPTDQPIAPVNASLNRKATDNASISSLSESDDEASGKKEKQRRGRLGFKDRLLGKKTSRTSNDSDNEKFEEARDTFEEERLAPPPTLTAAGGTSKASASPVRDSRFSEIL